MFAVHKNCFTCRCRWLGVECINSNAIGDVTVFPVLTPNETEN